MTKIAVITGANRGLGFATARHLGQSGVKVIVGARTLAKGEEAAGVLRSEGVDAEALQLDVDTPDSVQAAAERVEQQHGRVDILINNAGILPEATVPDVEPLDMRVFRATFETNSAPYQMSNAALNGFTVALSKSLADTPIKVNSVCPGWVQTDLGGDANRAAAPTTASDAARIVAEMASLGADGPTGQFVDEGGTVAW